MSKCSQYVVVEVGRLTPGLPKHAVAFHDDQLSTADPSPHRYKRLKMLLDDARIVPDVWRYNIIMRGAKAETITPLIGHEGVRLPRSRYIDVDAAAAVDKPVILLLLESPGDKEYGADADGTPVVRGPAQGRTGLAIDAYVQQVINEAAFDLPDGEYALVIANPVPYNCNLKWLANPSAQEVPERLNEEHAGRTQRSKGDALSALRDYVWMTLWLTQFVQDEFAERVNAYAPAAILNCCTKLLQPHVSAFLITTTSFGERLAEGPHPSVQWNFKYGGQAKRSLQVEATPSKRTRRGPSPIRRVTVKHVV